MTNVVHRPPRLGRVRTAPLTVAGAGRTTRQRVGKIVREAAMLANERLVEQGRPPLPNTTPHTMRRTYISIALRANNFDVKWVMSQVGHANSTMTMEVYAQPQPRVNPSARDGLRCAPQRGQKSAGER